MTEKQNRFIILKKIKYGESDLIIHALGSDGAKNSFMARSALKSKKRFGGGVLEPLHYVNLIYQERDDESKMKSLKEAILIDDFKNVRQDYDKLELALFVLNCVGHVSLEGDQHSEFLFNLTGHTLRAVSQECNLKRLKLHFCLKFLFQQGVVSLDAWMAPFLKTNISESNKLDSEIETTEVVDLYLDSIEMMVNQYIKTADMGYL